jgi:hypothetical protein
MTATDIAHIIFAVMWNVFWLVALANVLVLGGGIPWLGVMLGTLALAKSEQHAIGHVAPQL